MVDDGEAEAIALAYEKHWKVILDDRQARKVAKRLGVSMFGTVGILVQAKQHGIIPAIKPLLIKLEEENFYISDTLKEGALSLVGE